MPPCRLTVTLSSRAAGAIVGACVLLGSPARAQPVELDPAKWPLSSVGRVNVITGAGRRSQCTGTLIGPRHVLTAAHCLFNASRAMWAHPSSVHFVAGYARGEYRAHAQAVAYEKGAGFVHSAPPRLAAIADDWAVIRLASAIDLKPVRVRMGGDAAALTDVVRAGYRGDRAHVLTVQRDCASSTVSADGASLLRTCGSVTGESGSALLHVGRDGPEIVGILSANTPDFSLAVPSGTFAAAVARALEASSAPR